MTELESEAIEREIRVEAGPEAVFPFFTDPDLITRWKGKSASFDPRPGGIYMVQIHRRNIVRGEYIEVVLNSRFVFSWGWEGEDSPVPPSSSTVEITLTPDRDGTTRLLPEGRPSLRRGSARGHQRP